MAMHYLEYLQNNRAYEAAETGAVCQRVLTQCR